MKNLAKAVIIGRCGNEPEMRYTPNGNAVTTVSVAVSRYSKNASGDFDQLTSWFRVTGWKEIGERMNRDLFKGAFVYLECEMAWREWNDLEGNKRQGLELTVRDFGLLEKKRNTDNAEVAAALVGETSGENDNQLPF